MNLKSILEQSQSGVEPNTKLVLKLIKKPLLCLEYNLIEKKKMSMTLIYLKSSQCQNKSISGMKHQSISCQNQLGFKINT